jgi:hypothetical protein
MFDLREGIQRSAQALGVSPVDLATAISYETAGTFDPTKAGPTTQWGQHRGLIQFGEPQAQKYGVDWNNPVGSQLGEDGAVVKYLRDTGVQPGMGLLDIYSAINAGGVGRYGASDANNGGAPGTVRDKVEKQMAGHRRKAEDLFGGGSTPGFMAGSEGSDRMGAPMQQQDQEQRGLFGIKPELAMALAGGFANLSRPGSGNQFLQNAYATQARGQKDAKSKKARNQTAEWLRGNGYGEFADLVDSGAVAAGDVMGAIMQQRLAAPKDNRTSALKEYEFAKTQGYDGSFIDFQLAQKKAGATNISMGGDTQIGTIPQGYEAIRDEETGAIQMRPIAGGPKDNSAQEAVQQGIKDTSTELVLTAAERAREAARNRDFGAFGTTTVGGMFPQSDSAEVLRQVDTLKSLAAAENLNTMRAASPTGGALGNVTEKELALLQNKSGALDPNSPNFERDLADYERTLLRTIHGPEAGDAILSQARGGGQNTGGAPAGVDPEDWEFMTPEERALFQ